MPYVNQVVLSGGILQRILESGQGEKGDKFFILEYLLGKVIYPVLLFDKRNKMVDGFRPYPATIYGALTLRNSRIVIKANSIIDNTNSVEPEIEPQ